MKILYCVDDGGMKVRRKKLSWIFFKVSVLLKKFLDCWNFLVINYFSIKWLNNYLWVNLIRNMFFIKWWCYQFFEVLYGQIIYFLKLLENFGVLFQVGYIF